MATDIDTDDLNAFEAEFYQTKAPAKVEVKDASTEDEDSSDDLGEDDNPPATDDDVSNPEDEGDEPEDEEVEEETPKPKKKSAQERINELTAKAREADRRAADAVRRAELAEAAVAEKSKDKPEAKLRDVLPADAPNPDAVDDEGEPLYPLGELDPGFIRDLTRFTINAETKAAKETAKQEAIDARIESDRVELQSQWQDRVTEIEKELPDFRESTGELVNSLDGIDEGYGEYLATTIMASEYGPQIMYYLSQNIGEAQKIVASGPAAATYALGRLEAQFIRVPEAKRNKKVSGAPTPPETGSRGRGGKYTTPADTNDLDAFEREFYKKR